MNGTTNIDATLNPCCAEADRRTYGWRWLNVSTYGKRLLKVGVLGVYVDLHWSGWHRVMYVRVKNAAVLFFPGGSLTWPMPDKANESPVAS